MATPTWATVYRLAGQTDKEESQFEITNLKVASADLKQVYNFISELDAVATGNNILTQQDAITFIGASGKEFNVIDIFKKHELRALSVGDQDMSFTTNMDVDVLCTVGKVGYKYFIYIFTGEDAVEFRKKKAEKQQSK